MALRNSALLLALCGPGMALAAQAQGSAAGAPGPSTTAAAPASLPSATLGPSLDVLKTALGEVKVERWKVSGAVRGETETNLSSIQRDVDSTLPALMATADAAPDSAPKMLPLYRNLDALYDVLLRVAIAGRTAAPADQSSALDQALLRLEDGRRGLGDRLQKDTETEEQRAVHLEAALKAIPPPTPPPPPPAPPKCPATPARKKPAAKPSSTTTGSPTSTTPSH